MLTNLVKKYLLLITVVILLLSIAPVQKVSASVLVGYIFESTSSKVLINFFANYNYYSRDIPFRYRHEAEALDTVRETLVNQKGIQDIPILITLPAPLSRVLPEHTQLSLFEKGCSTDLGESIAETKTLGTCYKIYIKEEPSHDNLLALTLELQKLTATNQQIEVLNIEELKQTLFQELSQFQNITIRLDSFTSPDGRLEVSIVWRDEDVRFELLNLVSSVTQTLEPLKDYAATEPVWSPDSRYIAYASLNEVKIFDTIENTTKIIPLSSLFEGVHFETLITFEISENKLTFAGDTNLFDDYKVYEYDLLSQGFGPVATETIDLEKWPKEWENVSREIQYLSEQFNNEQPIEETNEVPETTPPNPRPFQQQHVDYIDTTEALIDWAKVLSVIFVVSGLGTWSLVRKRKKPQWQIILILLGLLLITTITFFTIIALFSDRSL